MSIEERVEAKLVLKQILSMCDRKTRAIIWGRIEGRSWDEISYDVVMSNHAARLHYSKALRAIRDALKTDPQQYIEGIKLAEREHQKKSRFISLWETVTAFLLFRALRLTDIWAVRLRITYHEKEEILSRSGQYVRLEVPCFEGFSAQSRPIEKNAETLLQEIPSVEMRGFLAGNFPIR